MNTHTIHQMRNELQAVFGYLDLKEYDKVGVHVRKLAHLLSALHNCRHCVELRLKHEREEKARNEKKKGADAP